MTWIEAALWGLFGGFAVGALDLYSVLRIRGCWPWRARGPREVGAAGYFVAELLRLAIGSGLACAAAESGQIATPFGALAVGISAPWIVERITRSIPLTDSVRDTAGGNEGPVPPQQYRADLTAAELNGQRVPSEEQRACADEAKKVTPRDGQLDQVGE